MNCNIQNQKNLMLKNILIFTKNAKLTQKELYKNSKKIWKENYESQSWVQRHIEKYKWYQLWNIAFSTKGLFKNTIQLPKKKTLKINISIFAMWISLMSFGNWKFYLTNIIPLQMQFQVRRRHISDKIWSKMNSR